MEVSRCLKRKAFQSKPTQPKSTRTEQDPQHADNKRQGRAPDENSNNMAYERELGFKALGIVHGDTAERSRKGGATSPQPIAQKRFPRPDVEGTTNDSNWKANLGA